MTGARAGRVLCALAVCLAVPAPRAQAPPPAPTRCPADGAARLGADVATLAERGRAAALTADPACVVEGLALLDWLDARGADACAGADRLAVLDGEGRDPDLLAFRAALEWRCGRPRAAWSLARRALAADEASVLGWRVLGSVLEARFRDAAAARAYRRALELDPAEAGALAGLARVTPARAERRAVLLRLLDAGEARGVPVENLRGARESLAFLDALGARQLWIVDRAELPGELPLEPLYVAVGTITGWVARIDLGGQERVPVLLDSGASGLHLDARIARKAHLEALSQGTLHGGGGAGRHTVERGVIAHVGVGPVTFRDALGVVGGNSLHPSGAYRAILGLDVLGGTRLLFEPQRGRLAIEDVVRPDGDDDPLAADPWPADARDLPVYSIEGQLLVPVRFAAADRDVEVLGLVDTGAAGTLLDEATAERLGPFRRGVSGGARGYGGKIGLAGVVPSLSVELGEVREALREVAVIDLSLRARLVEVHTGAFIGQDVWARHGFALDLATGTLRPGL